MPSGSSELENNYSTFACSSDLVGAYSRIHQSSGNLHNSSRAHEMILVPGIGSLIGRNRYARGVGSSGCVLNAYERSRSLETSKTRPSGSGRQPIDNQKRTLNGILSG